MCDEVGGCPQAGYWSAGEFPRSMSGHAAAKAAAADNRAAEDTGTTDERCMDADERRKAGGRNDRVVPAESRKSVFKNAGIRNARLSDS